MVVFATPEQNRRVSHLREAFEESNLPFRVDLFVWDDVPEQFRKQIKRDHVVFSENTNGHSAGRNWLYRPRFPSHWKRNPLHALAQWVNGLAFRNIQFSITGKPVIKIAEIKGGISGQTKFTTQAFDESVRVRSGDLLFSWSGQPETSIDAFWWRGPEGWLNQHIFRVTPINGVDSTFFYYLLRYLKPNFVAIARNKQTTGLGHVTRRDLENIEAALPDLPEQRAIAHVLGTLDDKIELNRRMNETLEAMARALFKSWFVDFLPVRAKMAAKQNNPSLLLPQAESGTWFVYAIECADGSLYIGQTENLRQRWLQHSSSKGGRWTKSHPPQRVAYWERQSSRQAAVERKKWLRTGFGRKWLKKEIATRTQTGDPVRAKMEGRDPGLPKHLADLFPDRLVDSELGPIPEGWEIGCFGDIVDQVRDKENPLASPDTDFRHFSIPAFDKDRWPQTERGENIKSQKSRVPPGVILLSKLNPEIERVWFVDVASDERAICSTEFLVLQARLPFQRNYVYCLTRSPFFRQQIGSLVTGTSKSHQRAQAGAVLALEATIPPAPVIRAFDQQASTLLNKSLGYLRETTTLVVLRNSLLPKFVSGKLRVDY